MTDHTQRRIRNFCIIAHIDHGKSTLADRLLELTGTIEPRAMKAQVLDSMELERERGITIKLQPARMAWNGFELHLIDTPGHVDFSYEVSRSIRAVEGAVLLVDATQGVQAQTLANLHLAKEASLKIIPVVNKIDLPAARTELVTTEVAELLGVEPSQVIGVSAKTGENVEAVLEAIISQIPAPPGEALAPAKALIFDSIYDSHRGVVLYVRVIDGGFGPKEELLLMGSGARGEILEVGHFAPSLSKDKRLEVGQIGYIITNLKSLEEARVGDTLTNPAHPTHSPLAGYQPIKPFVYGSFYATSNQDYPSLKRALGKLQLNDAALQFSPESSRVLGHGFRIGFLGLLHLEIIKQRLEREYQLDLIVTNPSTAYEVITTAGKTELIHSATQLPEPSRIKELREPWIKGEIIALKNQVGSVMQLLSSALGIRTSLHYAGEDRAAIGFEAPLAGILSDFYDRLKSATSGYGSLSYDLIGYRPGDLVKLDILVNGEIVEPLSQIVNRRQAVPNGRLVLDKLKAIIPRQLFKVSLQAGVGGKIIAREDLSATGKNVTAKLYGGDVTRKRKLLEKQKAGKARLKSIGQVVIPAEAFMVLLRRE